jgi:CubicO group peptidase (beta-lactamase class C family)
MKWTITILTGLALSGTAVAGQPDIEQVRLKYQLPALAAMSVISGSTTVLVSGVRQWGDKTLAQVSDKFHLGSCTKAMTATVLAIFIERGLLSWDSTLESLFPDLSSDMQEQFKKVSIGMLTAHRSGITGDIAHFQGGQLWQKLWDQQLDPVQGRKYVVHDTLTAPPANPPGSKFEYSNTNYMIAGSILERVSGKRWEDIMTEELFKPLGMNSCGFGVQADPKASPPDQPWPHKPSTNAPVAVTPDFHADNPPTLGPAGTVYCSMEDWTKFMLRNFKVLCPEGKNRPFPYPGRQKCAPLPCLGQGF